MITQLNNSNRAMQKAQVGTLLASLEAGGGTTTPVTPGVVEANKLVQVGADKNVDVLAILDLKLGSGAGTSVTATAAELNYNDISSLGTGAASKAVVLDAGGDYIFPAITTLRFAPGTVSSLRIGNWKAAQAAGEAVVFTAGMDSFTASDGQFDVFAVFGESVTDLTSAVSAKSGRFRHLVTFSGDTVVNQETYGLVGQLVVKNGSLNHYHGGLMGTFETGTLCHIQTGYGVGAVVARPGGAGTTVESGGLLAGFLAVQNMSAITATGTYAAFASHKTAGGVIWPIGLYMQSGSVTKAADLTAVSDGVYVTVGTLGVTNGRVAKFVGSVAAPAHADGYGAVEIDITASGTFSGPCATASSTWLNLASGSVPGGNIVTPRNDGIYVPTGVTTSSAKMIMGARMHYVDDDGAQPGGLFLFSTNISANVLTAMFDINAIIDTGGSATAASGNDYKIPFIKEASTGQIWYLNLYHS
jgi:hypothetical protein